MQSEGIPADAVTYLCCLTACSNIPDIVRGQELHRSISKEGLETGPMIGNSLVDMYGKCGLLASALALFEKLEIPDIVSWNSLIAGFSQHGECEDVFELLREMIGKNIDPDPVTFGSILSACSHAGLVDKGQMYFKIMSSYYGFIPMMEHFNCLSDIFGRAGQVEKAIAIIEHLPCHPSTALWHSVLASCRKTGHVELGEQAFECAIQLDDKDSSTYICMLNIYADEAHILDATSRR
jgi:pentatricopeptide repeat protein